MYAKQTNQKRFYILRNPLNILLQKRVEANHELLLAESHIIGQILNNLRDVNETSPDLRVLQRSFHVNQPGLHNSRADESASVRENIPRPKSTSLTSRTQKPQ